MPFPFGIVFVKVTRHFWNTYGYVLQRTEEDVALVIARRIFRCRHREDLDCVIREITCIIVQRKPCRWSRAPSKLAGDRPSTVLEGLARLSGEIAHWRVQLFFKKSGHNGNSRIELCTSICTVQQKIWGQTPLDSNLMGPLETYFLGDCLVSPTLGIARMQYKTRPLRIRLSIFREWNLNWKESGSNKRKNAISEIFLSCRDHSWKNK